MKAALLDALDTAVHAEAVGDSEYTGLGRVTQSWLPTPSRFTEPPPVRFRC
jgi:hypothetical protein